VLSITPLFWVGGVQQVVGALQSGAAILMLERIQAEAALTLAKREGATSLSGNFQRLRSLFGSADGSTTGIDTLRPQPKRPWDGPLSSKGEPPTPFGMTETLGPWSGIEEFDVRVVDPETGQAVPPGEVGEYWVRGYGLMAGLYKREREETFTPDSYYRTGDLGYFEQGQVYFRSRLNDMIKTKAANVAPPEVETVLTSFPDVRVAIVVGIPHEEYGQEVACAVVPEGGHEIRIEDLQARLRERISPYKVPTVVKVVSEQELPYLSSSKLDSREVAAMLTRFRDE
jgi:acyl-CoA synthetase (AMP-forming)/AMP-acid ligase II